MILKFNTSHAVLFLLLLCVFLQAKSDPEINLSHWEKVTSQANYQPRDGSPAIEFKNQTWMLGGWNNHGLTNEVWSSKDLKTWVQHKNAPWPARHGFGLLKFKDELWVISGDYHSDVWSSKNGIAWKLITAQANWGKRYAPYVCAFKNHIWLMGGQVATPLNWDKKEDQKVFGFNDVWQSTNGKTWKRIIEHAPWSPRALIHGCIANENKMYILGGGLKVGRKLSGRAETKIAYNDIWETEDGINWKQISARSVWQPRTHFSVINFNSNFLITDGSAGPQDNLTNKVWYSKNMIDWIELKNSPFGRRHASSLFIRNKELYLANGYLSNDIWKLNLQSVQQPTTASNNFNTQKPLQ